MATREYVGARYVPVFSDVNGGVWANTYSYEALTIVKNGTDFYTSKRPVPVGIDISNTAYWIKTGDYNGAISTLQTQIDNLDDVKAYEMGSRTFLFLADSYENLGQFLDKVGTYIKCKSYIKKVKAGASFIRHDAPYSQYTYINLLTNIMPCTPTEMDEITDIAIFASVNDDPNDDAEFESALTTFNNYVRNNMPNLKRVHLLSIGWASMSYAGQTKIQNNLVRYSKYAGRYGWSYIDCTRVMRLCQWMDTADGYHPTTAAGQYIAECCSEAILTGSCSWVSPICTSAYNVTFPAAFGSPSIIRPTGDFKIKARALANGDITWRFSSDFLVNSVDMTTYDQYTIKLTPQIAYNCPIPVYAEASETAVIGDAALATLISASETEVQIIVIGQYPSSNMLTSSRQQAKSPRLLFSSTLPTHSKLTSSTITTLTLACG